MDIYVHRPLSAVFPQVGSLLRASRRARAGPRAPRPRKALRRRKPLQPARSFDCGRFAPFAQDDEASRADGHICSSALDRRFSVGRDPQARVRAGGARAPSAVGAPRQGDGRLRTGYAADAAGVLDQWDPSTPAASPPALRMTNGPAACAQDDKTPARRFLAAAFLQIAIKTSRRPYSTALRCDRGE